VDAAKAAAVVVASGLAVIALAGCQAGTPSPTPTPSSASGLPSPSLSPTAPPSPSTSASALVPPCTALDITLTLGPGGGGGAGHRYPYLVFTNDSATACLLSGHPSVALVGGGNGVAIGAKATPVSSTSKQVILKPGKAAHAALDVAVAENYDPAQCQPQPADGLRVVLPNDSQSLFVTTSNWLGCANAAIKLMKVQPFVAGAK
jgi:hypothetical protein